jgi:hypothetical protein
MNGDFSQSNGHLSPLRIDPEDNFSGVLHQQGRVLLDRDWNAQTSITTHWQDQAGRDVIGTAVAAVPAGESDGVRIQSASVDASGQVELAIRPGRVWADGILAYLPGEEPDPTADVRRIATYLQPPIQDPPGDVSTIDEGVRDAVILEVWREALNGFQEPHTLIEPALGGPDTTERVLTAMRFRLFRLAPGDTCRSIVAGLQDDFENKGKLKVSLQPPTTIPGDCPVEEGGGYVGFEHFLYRVEIAQVDDPQVMFKWSQFNGGLVGRGDCDLGGTDKKITITANDQAIKMSGLSDVYLEVVELDPDQGLWRVTYGAEVTLNGDDLEVAQERYKESNLPSGNVFFRLWTEIRRIADFLKAAAPAEPTELRDGIRLEFDPAGAANYQPGDYWTFQVRAGEIPNLDVLIDDEPPQGIRYYRVPLAILNWNDDGDISVEEEEIEDCRDIFPPLTSQTGCCSFTVGDGVSSRGDFDSIEQAVRHLPVTGGDICLLPGLHKTNVVIEDRQNIKVRGCDRRTKVIPREEDREGPIFRIVDSQGITLERMDLISLGGTAIVVEGAEPGALQDVTIRDNRILAYENAVRAVRADSVNIHRNKMNMLDKEGAGVAIYMMAEDSVIERNNVSVVSAEASPPPPDDVVVDEQPPDPTDPCADLEVVYGNNIYLVGYAVALWEFVEILAPRNPFNALGGIQIAGGSERVKVLENRVWGGAGNGITLGNGLDASTPDDEVPDENRPVIRHTGRTISGIAIAAERGVEGITLAFQRNDDRPLQGVTDSKGIFAVPAEEGDYQVSVASPGYKIQSIEDVSSNSEIGPFFRINLEEAEVEPRDTLAFIYEIQIDQNEISEMGLSGIGIPRVAISDDPRRLLARLGSPVVTLAIYRNHIFNCLQNPFDSDLRAEARSRGFGGVALGLCGDLSIHENRIENNGTTHVEPTCGLYLAYGERIEITHNSVLANGPVATDSDDLQPGIRGGVVLGIASSLPVLDRLAKRDEARPGASPAARIHANVVEQPAGQAMRITAVGPVSVLGNYFTSELSGPEQLDLLAGAVLIRNLWSMFSTRTGVAARTSFSRAAVVNRDLANGNTLFNGNQTLVGSNNTSATSQLILSTADIGFDGNQSDNLKRGFLFSNTLLLGPTLRASDNRLKEAGDDGDEDPVFTSLLTLTGMLNNTTNNQGDHCIIAFNQDSQRPAIESGNQELPAGAGQCRSRREFILRNADALISTILRAIGGLGEIK